jgi:hypothetical protein
MEFSEIVTRENYLQTLPMGPERWSGDLELRGEKARCADYQHKSQNITFAAWMNQLTEASRHSGVDWGTEEIRADYYEGQPDAWVDYYDSGDSPEEAIDSDMSCWD